MSACVIGSGSGAIAFAKIIADNTKVLTDFEENVNLYLFKEEFEGQGVSEMFCRRQKDPTDFKLPENVVTVSDLVASARYADLIIFVMPYDHIVNFCKTLLGKIKPDAIALTVTKGFSPAEDGGLQLVSQTIMKHLKIPCAVLMEANLADEIAADKFCWATLGCRDGKQAKLFSKVFQSKNFRVTVVDDADCVEACGFLKHVISFGSGIVDGLDCNDNAKATCIRFGLLEMIRFVDVFYPGSKLSTFFESCGLADLITVCSSSRNRRMAEIFVRSKEPIKEIEMKLMGGETLMGPVAANAISVMLKCKGLEDDFPLFTTIHQICQYTLPPEAILECFRNMPYTKYHPTNVFPL